MKQVKNQNETAPKKKKKKWVCRRGSSDIALAQQVYSLRLAWATQTDPSQEINVSYLRDQMIK
jgi:hypothetical protein